MSKQEKLAAFLERFARWYTSDASYGPVVIAWEEYLTTPDDHPPAADEHKARVAELESQLAERSPGVMPECVRDFIDHVLRRDNKRLPLGPVTFEMRKAVEAYFSPPEGHEWQPVDADHPVTAADVGRKVCRLNETVSVFGASSGWSTTSEVYILRPIASPFVFAGEPGRYLADKSLIVDVCRVNGKLYAILIEQMKIFTLESDGSFAGVRITGRVSG